MPSNTRTFFETRFGHDFSRVRIHSDPAAAASAQAVDAQAYTVGQHVVFAPGQYAPDSGTGRRLLAHELTHVVQQANSHGNKPLVQRKGGRGPGSCGLLSAAAATVLGSIAHVQIQTKLAARGIIPELEIPRASKTNGISRRCARFGTPPGFADLAKVARPIVSIGEIKPYYIAQVAGRIEARHYRRRAEQSKQRLTGTGGCGRRSGPGPDDFGFSFNPLVGPIGLTSVFMPLIGAISGTENFGTYPSDPYRDLKAKEVGGGAIGYWCALNAAGKKKKEAEKKAKQKKPKGKAGAANVGLGVSIGGSNVGGANAGIGISIDSNSAAVGTAGAGIAISSDSAAAGAAGAGITQDTSGAAAGAVGAGAAKDSEAVAAGAAGAGKVSGSTSAGAGVAGAGKSKDNISAAAGVAGKGEVKDSVAASAGAAGSGKTEGVVGASTGSPKTLKKPIDPSDVSGADADKQPPGQGDEQAEKGSGDGAATASRKEGEADGKDGQLVDGKGDSSGEKARSGGQGGDSKTVASGGEKGTNASGEGGRQAAAGKGTGTATGTGTGSGNKPLGVYTVIPLGTSEADRDKFAAEAAKVAELIKNASQAQLELFRHLSKNSPDKRYLVPASDWVQKMMNVTKGLTVDEIEYLKQLDWKPGKISEEELRKRLQKTLANRNKPKTSADGDAAKAAKISSEAKGGSKGKSGSGQGAGAGADAPQRKQQTSEGDVGSKAQGTGSKGSADRAVDPPAGSNRATAGIFGFQILTGITLHSHPAPNTAVDCKVLIEDNHRSFELTDVSITFVEAIETLVTIKGVKFVTVQYKVYFTKDFWSEKNKFYGKGGTESLTDVDMGRRKVQ